MQADAEPRAVHHDEHRLEPAVRLADHPTGRVFHVHHAGGVAVNAHLVLDRSALNGVARAHIAFGVGQELRHDEKRDALGSGRSVGKARQDQVHDVLTQVVLAGADEDLRPGDLEGAVLAGLGLRAQEPEVGSALRLGEAHRARPFAGDELGQEHALLLVGAVGVQRFVRSMREARVHREGLVGRIDDFLEGIPEGVRQSLPAMGRIGGDGRPTGVAELVVSLLEALGRRHHAVVEVAPLDVADLVQGEEDLRRQLSSLLEDLVDDVGRGFVTRWNELQVVRVFNTELRDDVGPVLEELIHQENAVCRLACRLGGGSASPDVFG